MKAEQNKIYAQIQGGKVSWIFTANELPEWNDGLLTVDVTGDVPQVGWLYDGTNFAPPPLPVKTLDEQIAAFTAAVSAHLDATVQVRGYDSILSCASYATSINATFKAEAQAVIAWRDAVWAYCYAELAKVQAGARVVPVSEAAFTAELPVLVW